MRRLLKRLALFSLALLAVGALASCSSGGGGGDGDGDGGTPTVQAVSAGGASTLARMSDGTVRAWGWNENGQLGDGTTTDKLTPVQVKGLTGVREIDAGFNHCVAVKRDGTVRAWGLNENGQLGDGTTTDKLAPVRVKGPVGEEWLTGVDEVSAGSHHSLALRSDGTVWAWGLNDRGQLGDGTTTDSPLPVQTKTGSFWTLEDASEVAAGGAHSLAVSFDNPLFDWIQAWGDNQYGQLGDGTTTDSSYAISANAVNLSDMIQLAAGTYHSVALRNDGTVRTWGRNNYGQLGDGTTNGHLTPVQIALTGVVDIAAGSFHTVALRSDGTVWAWGVNSYGQLGDGTTTNKYTPVQIGLTNVVDIDAGDFHTVALRSDGTVWTWGWNWRGQLGIGTADLDPHPFPVWVSGL